MAPRARPAVVARYELTFEDYAEANSGINVGVGPVRGPPPSRGRPAALLPWLLAGVLASFFLVLIANRGDRHGSSRPHPATVVSPTWRDFLPLVPLAFLVVLAVYVMARRRRQAAARYWAAQAHLRRPQTLEVEPELLRWSDGFSRHEHIWDAFPFTRETPSLFLVYTSSVAFYIIPKRAFAREADIAEFRALLQRRVEQRQPAFPVVIAGPKAPVAMAEPADSR